jgi:hypothetical protein
MTEIQRWDFDEGSIWERVVESEFGEFVFYEHHLAIVEKLKAEIAELSLERLYESYNEIFHKGYQDGWNDAKQFLRFD